MRTHVLACRLHYVTLMRSYILLSTKRQQLIFFYQWNVNGTLHEYGRRCGAAVSTVASQLKGQAPLCAVSPSFPSLTQLPPSLS